MGYNSWMHRKIVRIKKYSAEERAQMKRDMIAEQERMRKAREEPNPLRGLLGFFGAMKRRNRERMKGDNDEQVPQESGTDGPSLGVIKSPQEEAGSGTDH